MNKKFVTLIPSIILYIAAGVVAAFALWACSHSADIVSQAREAGQLTTSENAFDIASFYMANSGQYFIYSLILASIGFVLQKKTPVPEIPTPSAEMNNKEDYDKELDEWFEEIETSDKSES